MTQSELGRRTLSALNWSYGGAIARVVAQLLVQLLLARFLGPEAFGQATAAFFVLALGWLLAEGGFGAALVQKAEVNDDDIGYALGWVLLLSCSAGALVAVLSPWLAVWLGNAQLSSLVMASGLLIPVQAVSNIPTSLMRRNLDMKRSQIIYLGGYMVAYMGVGLPLAWAHAGPWSLVAAFGLHSFINFAASYAVVRHTLRPRLRGDRALRRFGLQVTGTNATNWFIENVDRLLVNRYWGTVSLGEYTAAYTLSRAPANFLISSIQSVAFASAARMQSELARLARVYLALLSLVALITFPMFAYLAMHADLVVHLLYGGRWLGAGPLFAAFCAGLPCYAVLAITGPMLWAVDGVHKELVVQITGSVLLLGGFLALAGLPLAQAVWLVPLIYVLRAGWVYQALAARVGIRHRFALRSAAPGIVLAVAVVVIAWGTRHLLGAEIPAAVLSALLVTGMALVCVWRWPASLLSPELRSLLVNRSGDSRLLASICRWLRLRPA